ncbi:MAG: hypothetical protein K2W96_10955 [Gemmataceae bacterium]|nr:hypothetical protein [Gemmataceae bacterium]
MPRPLTEAEQADLVAYLDGELKGEAARAVEAKVSVDPAWRAEAAAHKQAWDMLDFLPRPEPTPSFTERTLSRLEPIRRSDPGTMPPTDRPSRAWLWWSAGVVAAALGGWLACWAALPTGPGERELVRDLRLIENLRIYERIEDAGFLEELAHPDLFGD